MYSYEKVCLNYSKYIYNARNVLNIQVTSRYLINLMWEIIGNIQPMGICAV